jgi:hypothetical protein
LERFVKKTQATKVIETKLNGMLASQVDVLAGSSRSSRSSDGR